MGRGAAAAVVSEVEVAWMETRSGVDGTIPIQTAHERFKSRSRLHFWLALGIAVLIHLAVLSWWPGLQFGGDRGGVEQQEMQAIRLIPAIESQAPTIARPLPPEPVVLGRAAPAAERRSTRRVERRTPVPTRPPELEARVSDDVEALIEATRSRSRVAPAVVAPPLPPPAPAAPAAVEPGLARFKRVTALMEKPELTNRSQVRRALLREYPRALQVKRIEGSVIVWVWIDEKGKVIKYEIRGSSGHLALDAAAERVIPVMKFRPAKDRGKAVPVVATLPIKFEVE
jgi:TonB family protein